MPTRYQDFSNLSGDFRWQKKGTMKEQQELAALLLLLAILKAKLIATQECHRERRNAVSDRSSRTNIAHFFAKT